MEKYFTIWKSRRKAKSFIVVILSALFLFILINNISAQPPFQQSSLSEKSILIESPVIEYHKINTDFSFHIHAHNSTDGTILRNDTTYCLIHIYNSSGEHILTENMSFNGDGYDFEINVLKGNFSESGQKAVLFYCQSTSGTDERGGFFEYAFYLTTNGEEPSYSFLIAMIVLILTFIGLGLLIHKDKQKMDDESYWNKMFKRWHDKNYIRFSAIVVWYNLKKNAFVLYYLIGLVMMVMIYDITQIYNIVSVVSIFRILLSLYMWGSLFVIMVVFGKVQEWIFEWKEEIENINWGDFYNGK